MSKKIFNILMVLLLVFITVYFSLKISQYAMQLQEADDAYNKNNASISPYSITYSINK